MAESTVLEDLETGDKQRQARYFKAKVLDSHQAEQINHLIGESLDEKSIVFTDKSTSYVDIADFVDLHITEKSNKETTEETLKWVHITISNAKRNFLGNYHKIRKYLKNISNYDLKNITTKSLDLEGLKDFLINFCNFSEEFILNNLKCLI